MSLGLSMLLLFPYLRHSQRRPFPFKLFLPASPMSRGRRTLPSVPSQWYQHHRRRQPHPTQLRRHLLSDRKLPSRRRVARPHSPQFSPSTGYRYRPIALLGYWASVSSSSASSYSPLHLSSGLFRIFALDILPSWCALKQIGLVILLPLRLLLCDFAR